VTVPPYALPLALVAVPAALIAAALWFAVAHWPLTKVASGRMVAAWAMALGGLAVVVWGMAARGDWTPPDGLGSLVGLVLGLPLVVLLAGGEDSGPVVAAAAAEMVRTHPSTDREEIAAAVRRLAR
jgi:hypothetical protein